MGKCLACHRPEKKGVDEIPLALNWSWNIRQAAAT
jgi:hypothetical protein